jgi:hypothetical protein
MAERTFKQSIPANARIIIDYDAKEPVKFSYPRRWTYWKAVIWQASINYITFWQQIHAQIVYTIAIPAILFALIKASFFPHDIVTAASVTHYNLKYVLWGFLTAVALLFYIIGIPFLFCIYLAKFHKKFFSEITPKVGYWSALLRYGQCWAQFNSKDLNEHNQIILPNFGNVYLKYKATKEFGKFLRKVEILEYSHKLQKSEFFRPWKHKRPRKQDSFWYARFQFSQAPKSGNLKIVYI